jgi:hypothetical protein
VLIVERKQDKNGDYILLQVTADHYEKHILPNIYPVGGPPGAPPPFPTDGILKEFYLFKKSAENEKANNKQKEFSINNIKYDYLSEDRKKGYEEIVKELMSKHSQNMDVDRSDIEKRIQNLKGKIGPEVRKTGFVTILARKCNVDDNNHIIKHHQNSENDENNREESDLSFFGSHEIDYNSLLIAIPSPRPLNENDLNHRDDDEYNNKIQSIIQQMQQQKSNQPNESTNFKNIALRKVSSIENTHDDSSKDESTNSNFTDFKKTRKLRVRTRYQKNKSPQNSLHKRLGHEFSENKIDLIEISIRHNSHSFEQQTSPQNLSVKDLIKNYDMSTKNDEKFAAVQTFHDSKKTPDPSKQHFNSKFNINAPPLPIPKYTSSEISRDEDDIGEELATNQTIILHEDNNAKKTAALNNYDSPHNKPMICHACEEDKFPIELGGKSSKVKIVKDFFEKASIGQHTPQLQHLCRPKSKSKITAHEIVEPEIVNKEKSKTELSSSSFSTSGQNQKNNSMSNLTIITKFEDPKSMHKSQTSTPKLRNFSENIGLLKIASPIQPPQNHPLMIPENKPNNQIIKTKKVLNIAAKKVTIKREANIEEDSLRTTLLERMISFNDNRLIPFLSSSKIDLKDLLETGRFSYVYSGTLAAGNTNTTSRVRVKIVKKLRNVNVMAKLHANMLNEIEILKRVEHKKRILNYVGLCDEQSSVWLITDIGYEVSLYEFYRQKAALLYYNTTMFDLVCIMKQAGKAINFVHKKDIIHRNLKSSNFSLTIINNQFRVKLGDFSYARVLNNHLVYKDHMIVGTSYW